MLVLLGMFGEAERHWQRYQDYWRGELDFSDLVFQGDSHLCKARPVLGMAVRDDEWDVEFPVPTPPYANQTEALTQLALAEESYHKADTKALAEDARLETTYYTRTLTERLERVRSIRMALEPSSE